MRTAAAKQYEIIEGDTVVSVGRITGPDGTVLQQAHFLTIDVLAYDMSNLQDEPVLDASGLLPADVIFDELQFGGFDDELGDGAGHNFRFSTSTDAWDSCKGGKSYLIEYRFNTTVAGTKTYQTILKVRTRRTPRADP